MKKKGLFGLKAKDSIRFIRKPKKRNEGCHEEAYFHLDSVYRK